MSTTSLSFRALIVGVSKSTPSTSFWLCVVSFVVVWWLLLWLCLLFLMFLILGPLQYRCTYLHRCHSGSHLPMGSLPFPCWVLAPCWHICLHSLTWFRCFFLHPIFYPGH
ncbi:uncharacterized protein LOC107642926 isoform X3 [Arachis ipaensis]|uniref:uncharacterized protein LOC107642926 isoform X3 n=1 Tax=Arachis ipaensis TaxID=130454 RepID=UPI000A2B2575|nr:uncharacterized protein LOC107642926 isoform X3 [Arachis ipaensis]XP_025653541.1 uncharacterized protein LOC112749496 isoform X3 [Arachis hypogaea]